MLEIQAVFWSTSPAFVFITGWQNSAEWNNELSGLTRHKILLKDHEELPTIARQRETKENATAEPASRIHVDTRECNRNGLLIQIELG